MSSTNHAAAALRWGILAALVLGVGCTGQRDPAEHGAGSASTRESTAGDGALGGDGSRPTGAGSSAEDPPHPSPGEEPHGEEQHEEQHAGEGQGRGHDHGHDHDEAAPSFDGDLLRSVAGRSCEHGVKILACDRCRYEVGAVQLENLPGAGTAQELVRVAPLKRAPLARAARLTGEVTFDETRVAHISPRVEGVARRVFVTRGAQVKAADPLLEMDSIALGKLRSAYLQARARLKLARHNHRREKTLFEQRIASAKELLQAEAALREAEIALSAAQDQLRLVGLPAPRGPGSGGGRLLLRAPLAGVVVSGHVVPGERIAPDREVFTVADLSRVWVQARAYERDLSSLLAAEAQGQALAAEVSVAAFEGRAFSGKVAYVGKVMDPRSRTVEVRVLVDNAGGLLRPGMFARVTVALPGSGSALQVPAEAVMEDEGQRFVFVEARPGLFLRRDVTLGPRVAGAHAVQRGLRAGERVAVRGAFLLKSDILREKMGAGCAD